MRPYSLLFLAVTISAAGQPEDAAGVNSDNVADVGAAHTALSGDAMMQVRDGRLPADAVLREKLLEVGNSFGWALVYEDRREGLYIWRFLMTGFDHPPYEGRFTWYVKRSGNRIILDDPALIAAESRHLSRAQPVVRYFQEEFKQRFFALVGPVALRAPGARTHSHDRYIHALEQTMQETDLPPVAGEHVVVTSERAEITRDGNVVDMVFRGAVLTVRGFDENRLSVCELQPGTISRSDVTSLDSAIERFTEEIGRNPDEPALYVMRGHALTFKGRYADAIADHDTALRLEPNDPTAYHRRGLAWGFQGEYSQAVAEFTEALRLAPMDATVFNDRGTARARMLDYRKALADFNEAVRLEPGFGRAINNRGAAWARAGDDDLALADFDEALRLDPGDALALYRRSELWSRRRQRESAFDDLMAAIRLDPRYVMRLDPRLIGPRQRSRTGPSRPESPREQTERHEPTATREDLERRASAKLMLARQYLDNNLDGAARRHLEQIIVDYPDTRAAEEARIVLDAID